MKWAYKIVSLIVSGNDIKVVGLDYMTRLYTIYYW